MVPIKIPTVALVDKVFPKLSSHRLNSKSGYRDGSHLVVVNPIVSFADSSKTKQQFVIIRPDDPATDTGDVIDTVVGPAKPSSVILNIQQNRTKSLFLK
jgi:hypothetical protein